MHPDEATLCTAANATAPSTRLTVGAFDGVIEQSRACLLSLLFGMEDLS
jgi:hypothetical protein